MKTFLRIFLIVTIASITKIFAAPPANVTNGSAITGHIYDADQSIAIGYANVILYSAQDSIQVSGAATDDEGDFVITGIKPGKYYMDIFYVGYSPKRVKNILVDSDKNINLGKIPIKQNVVSTEDIEVEAQRSPISYQIDKKVINVARQNTVTSGTAVDVLENIPSVTVDIDGNVSLRGSEDFTVLIDGRPSVLDPSDALQQIPASAIENIEIITNPSAKYDPSGTAGIINIIMKKNKNFGTSGVFNINGGLGEKYGTDFTYQHRDRIYSFVLGANYRRMFFDGDNIGRDETTTNDLTSYIYSNGSTVRGRKSMGLRGEVTVPLSEKDDLNFGGRYGDRNWQHNENLDYNTWLSSESLHDYYNSISNRSRGGTFYALNANYKHQFSTRNHEINSEFFYSHNNADEKTVNELMTAENGINDGQKSTETGPSTRFQAKLEYTLPLGKDKKFEAGYQGRLNTAYDYTNRYLYNTNSKVYEIQDAYSNRTRYKRDTHAIYTLYAGTWYNIGYQGGIRTEYTGQDVDFSRASQTFSIDRWDFFPTLHFSYKFSDGQQMMTSYTRRIQRPRGWYLEPFETWIDAYNVRIGNPKLKPEYIDSYELGYQTFFGKSLFSADLYFRQTNNKVERVQSVYSENVTLQSIENVGKDYAFGSELLLNYDPLKQWTINLTGNLYNYKVEGVINDQNFARQSFNWNSRLNNNFKIGKMTQLQLDGIYNSPTVSSQGRREGFFAVNAAIKFEFLEKSLSATLQARDLFATGKYERISQGTDFYKYTYATREAPLLMLNIRYNLNNYKSDDRNNGTENEPDNNPNGEEF